MTTFLKFCSIVSIIIAAIKLAMMGNLSESTVVFIIISGIIILVGNRTMYIVASAIAALVLFVKLYGGDSTGQIALTQSILTLAVMCLGLYVMLRGFFRRRNNNRSL